MFIIRPIEEKDLDGLLKLLENSGHGLTSLPRDPAFLEKRIRISERSFLHREDGPGGEDYLFVMEETFTGRIVGVCAIISKIGGFQPYYFYRLEKTHHESKLINVKNDVTSLHFHFVHNGPAEICSLYLDPEFRNAQNGRFLSLSRFLFMAENRKFFEDEVIAEMRGMVKDSGHSAFWNAVGKHFFKVDFPTADSLYMKNKRFIEELLPKHPIMANLLPKEAQDVIAQVHPNTEPAKKILEQEGFTFSGLVGIFDPGPVLTAQVDNIRAIRESVVGEITEISDKPFKSEDFIIAKTTEDFCCVLGGVAKVKTGGYKISGVAAATLKLRLGERIRFVSFKASGEKKKKVAEKTKTKKK